LYSGENRKFFVQFYRINRLWREERVEKASFEARMEDSACLLRPGFESERQMTRRH